MSPGQQFSCIAAMGIAGRLERVVGVNDGRVVTKIQQGTDVVYTVEKT